MTTDAPVEQLLGWERADSFWTAWYTDATRNRMEFRAEVDDLAAWLDEELAGQWDFLHNPGAATLATWEVYEEGKLRDHRLGEGATIRDALVAAVRYHHATRVRS